MKAGELLTVREGLGMTRGELARQLSVREDTIKKWETGKEPIPYRVREEIEALETYTAETVRTLVDALNRSPVVATVVYRTSEEMDDKPDFQVLGAGWWRMVVYRASLEVPEMGIGYECELEQERGGVSFPPFTY